MRRGWNNERHADRPRAPDLFRKSEVATAAGLAGTAAWLGQFFVSLLMGAWVTTIAYNPFFVSLALFDLVGAPILWTVVRRDEPAPAAIPSATLGTA